MGLLALTVSLVACSSSAQDTPRAALAMDEAPYDFTQPTAILKLSNRLDEISGLTTISDELLAAVEDEEGEVYFLDVASGEILDKKKFHKDGDYEGIERVGDQLYVLQSDGDLFAMPDWRADELKAEKFETALRQRNDTEGLAYDATHHRLLIACKEDPGDGYDGFRTIYAFDLATETLDETPAFRINLAALEAQAPADNAVNTALRNLLRPLADVDRFKPSALAVHPLTGDLYVLSSVLKVLVILDAEGHLAAVWPLPEDDHAQPEGLAFLSTGDLLIANEEASNNRGTLVRYTYRP